MLHLNREVAVEQDGPNLDPEAKCCRLVVLKKSVPGGTGDLHCASGKFHAVQYVAKPVQ